MRVLILAPIGRDAALLASTVEAIGVETSISSDLRGLTEELAVGAGAAIIAEEAIIPHHNQALAIFIESQPAWSDMPFVILTSAGRPTRESQARAAELKGLGNMTLLERPVRPETVQSAVQAALRARMRQYEIRSRQEALIQANADLEQFAHSASHDLREPLRNIAIYSEILKSEYSGSLDEKGLEFLALINKGATRMDALLSDLLSYAHASSISEEEPAEAIAAMRPLQSALENLAGVISESQAEIIIGDMPSVRMRESHLSQIFQNLIGNAIKYRKENVSLRVELTAARAAGFWEFSVTDNGIGVPPEYRETIFGLFKRLHTATKYAGTGMGLAICQRIVERYRGRIWVESEAGRGSRFFFTVPR